MGESMWLRSMMLALPHTRLLTYAHVRAHTAAARGEWIGFVVAHQHHRQRLTHRSPIRAAVTRQPVSKTLTAGVDEDSEPLV